jgi:hypothetical protein
MSDARGSDSVEQRLALVARGVQRMADAFGALEQRLTDLADAERLQALSDRTDEYRVRTRAEVAQVAERVEKLESETKRAIDLLRSIGTTIDTGPARPTWVDDLFERLAVLERRVAERPAAAAAPTVDLGGPMDRLIDAVRGLRDDIAVAIGELRVETTASIERVIVEQSSRLTRLHEAVAAARQTPSTPRLDELQRALDDVLAEVRSVHGEVVSASGQLRTDIAADVAAMRDALAAQPPALTTGAPTALPAEVDDSRLAAIEHVIASLRDELAIDRLEASMRDMAQDTSGLRADVRRSFDRVLHEIASSEESLKGEVRAIDGRLAGFGDDLRLVRGLRDSLEALASGVDAVRQLAARSATSSQMGELASDLSTVLAEIESARAQVLSVDQQVGALQASAIDVDAPPPAADVAKSVMDLERTVTDEMADLGARIEEIAERTVTATSEPDDPVAARLRSLATSARQLSMGIAEDLKARRGTKKRKPVRER